MDLGTDVFLSWLSRDLICSDEVGGSCTGRTPFIEHLLHTEPVLLPVLVNSACITARFGRCCDVSHLAHEEAEVDRRASCPASNLHGHRLGLSAV